MAGGRRTERAPELAAELRRALVTDLEGGAGGIEALVQHQRPGFVEAQELLELQRGHRRDSPEVAVEGRLAHARAGRETLDTDRLAVMRLEVRDGASDAVALAAHQGHLPEPLSEIARQEPEQHLAFLVRLLPEGRATGAFREDLDPEVTAALIASFFKGVGFQLGASPEAARAAATQLEHFIVEVAA